MKTIYMDFYRYEVTGENEEAAVTEFEKRMDVLDHERGYGHIDSTTYEVETSELPKYIEEKFGVSIKAGSDG